MAQTWNLIVTERLLRMILPMQTGEEDIFAGGDALTGPKFAIDAIAAGKQGAISIHRYVQPGQSLVLGRDRRAYKSLDKEALALDTFDRMPRQQAAQTKAKNQFADDRGTFTEAQVKKETERCLGCGAVVVDEFLCVGCGQCTTKCKFDAISLVRRYDGEGVSLFDMKKVIVPHVIKRKVKIQMKKIGNVFKPKEEGEQACMSWELWRKWCAWLKKWRISRI